MKNESLKAITEVLKPKMVINSLPPSAVQDTDIKTYLESIERYEQEILATSMKYIDDSIALLDQISSQDGVAPLTQQEDSSTPLELSPPITMRQL